MEESQDFGDDETSGYRAHKRGTHRFACEQGNAAAIKIAAREHVRVSGSMEKVVAGPFIPPDSCGTSRGRKCVKANRAKVLMSATKSGFNDEVEAHLIQGLSAKCIVEPTQSDGRLLGAPCKVPVEQALANRRVKSATLRPGGHRPRLLLTDHFGIGEDGCALGRSCDAINVLQN